jgi:hypothetical protein
MHMRRITLSSVACPDLTHFTLSHKQHDFRKKKIILHEMFWFSLQFLYETFIILRKPEGDIIINIYWSIGLDVKYPLFLSDFNKTWIFLHTFSESSEVSNFMKIRRMGVDTASLDGRVDRQTTKLTLAFHNFVNSLKIYIVGRPVFLVSRLRSLSDGSPLRISMSVHISTGLCSCAEAYIIHFFRFEPCKTCGHRTAYIRRCLL